MTYDLLSLILTNVSLRKCLPERVYLYPDQYCVIDDLKWEWDLWSKCLSNVTCVSCWLWLEECKLKSHLGFSDKLIFLTLSEEKNIFVLCCGHKWWMEGCWFDPCKELLPMCPWAGLVQRDCAVMAIFCGDILWNTQRLAGHVVLNKD